jgi:hypothetical protein
MEDRERVRSDTLRVQLNALVSIELSFAGARGLSPQVATSALEHFPAPVVFKETAYDSLLL